MDTDPGNIGLLLVGRGHPAPDPREQRSSDKRYRQESDFQNKVRQALIKVGFDESQVAIGWLRSNSPTVAEALELLISVGCKSVLWLPSAFSADGVNTLCDVPTQIDSKAREHGIKLASLGAWNADDLTAEDIAARVRAVTDAIPSPALSQNA